MATREQVEELWGLVDQAKPPNPFGMVDNVNAGIHAALRFLVEQEPEGASAGAISEHLGVSTARVAVLIKKMVDRGLVTREHSATDARVIMVRATDQGRQVVFDAREDIIERVGRLIDELGEERLRDFLSTAIEIGRIMGKPPRAL